MKWLACIAFAMASTPAFAQSPDKLCATIDSWIAAARDKTPFTSLSTEWKPGRTTDPLIDKKPEGLGQSCYLKVPASGSPTEAYCTFAMNNSLTSSNPQADTQKVMFEVFDRVAACMKARSGWKGAGARREEGNTSYEEGVWTSAATPAQVVVDMGTQRIGDIYNRRLSYTASVRVRLPASSLASGQ